MSLSVIMEEPSGFQDGDLEFVGRVSHGPNRRRPKTYGGMNSESQRYGSPKGRYIRGHSGRSLGGLRLSSQSYSPNAPGPGPSRGGTPKVVPIRFARNPRHPKSMYDTEISMRNFIRGHPLKLSSGLSFPDPRGAGAFRNPAAPKFHHEFDITEEDYNIQHNPLAGMDMSAFLSGSPVVNRGYDYTGDDGSGGDSSDSDDQDESVSARDNEGSAVDDSTIMDDSASRRAGDGTPAIYSTVQKYRASPPPPPVQLRQEPPFFAPQPPPLEGFSSHVIVLPRAVAHFEMKEEMPPQEEEEVPPPLPTPLHTLAEEEEPQELEVLEDEEELQELRDMSTQTNVTVQDIIDPGAEQEEESEDRFVQIGEGRAESEAMTHENWEAVAPWSRQSLSSVQVTPDTSLAVNYRRVVAELSGTERQASPSQQRPEERRPEPPPPRRHPQINEDPPPWSPPIVPQVEQILRPIRPGGMEMDYPHQSREFGQHRGHRRTVSLADCLNRCCLVTLLILAVFIIIGAVVVTILYASHYSNCTSSCGLVQQPGYLGGFVALGALAILVVFGLFTWCCYNVTKRQHMHKFRTRERH